MIEGENYILQAFLGTLVTWGLTAVGSAVVFIFALGYFSSKTGRKILDMSLGFAGGVMLAASFWSLLMPAIAEAEESGYYGTRWNWAPVSIGFLLGGVFVLLSDMCLPCLTKKDPELQVQLGGGGEATYTKKDETAMNGDATAENVVAVSEDKPLKDAENQNTEGITLNVDESADPCQPFHDLEEKKQKWKSWKRIVILIIAITVHNAPEGLAIGVKFASIDAQTNSTKAAEQFKSARNLALAIGIQNCPEGMAVSVPMLAAGYHPAKCFFYGQLSGMVEPVFAILGALITSVAQGLLPYALAFGAGAMIYVVFDDLIPEAAARGNTKLATWGGMIGFVIMMCLEVGLGLE